MSLQNHLVHHVIPRLFILSRGACPRRSIELIGVSTKRNDPTTVGQFGSGTAFAICLALRTAIGVTFSSVDPHHGPYTMVPWANDNDRVYWRYRSGSTYQTSWYHRIENALGAARSIPTSFSKEFGALDWHGSWPVVREFVTNARDADPNGYVVTTNIDEVAEFIENHRESTVVELNNVNMPLFEHWGNYFRFERPKNFSKHDGPGDPIFRSSVFGALYKEPGSSAKLFVRGVRVEHGVQGPSMFSWVLDMELTEARTLKRDYDLIWNAAMMLNAACEEDPELARAVVNFVAMNPDSFEAKLPMEHIVRPASTQPTGANGWLHAIKGKRVTGLGEVAEMAPDERVLELPASWRSAMGRVMKPARSHLITSVANRAIEVLTASNQFSESELEWLGTILRDAR